MRDSANSIANTLELSQSGTKLWIYKLANEESSKTEYKMLYAWSCYGNDMQYN